MEARQRNGARSEKRKKKTERERVVLHLPSSLMGSGLTAVLFNSSDVPAVKSWTNKWTVQRKNQAAKRDSGSFDYSGLTGEIIICPAHCSAKLYNSHSPRLALQQPELSGRLFPLLFFSFLLCNESRQKPREKAALDCAHVGGQGQQREQRRVLPVC